MICAQLTFHLVLLAAEAIAATLYITGFAAYARRVLLPFNWGPEFFKVNGELLDLYAAAPNSQAVVSVQVLCMRFGHSHPYLKVHTYVCQRTL